MLISGIYETAFRLSMKVLARLGLEEIPTPSNSRWHAFSVLNIYIILNSYKVPKTVRRLRREVSAVSPCHQYSIFAVSVKILQEATNTNGFMWLWGWQAPMCSVSREELWLQVKSKDRWRTLFPFHCHAREGSSYSAFSILAFQYLPQDLPLGRATSLSPLIQLWFTQIHHQSHTQNNACQPGVQAN